VLAAANAAMAVIPNERLFVDANLHNRNLFERWCAGSFGVAYHRFVAHCEVAMNSEPDAADFTLRKKETQAKGPVFPFQTVEVMEPGRRRSQEYRNPRLTPYTPGQGAIDGPSWIEAGVRKKVHKRYSGAKQLHILVYVNFDAEGLEYAEVSHRLTQFRSDFASVWVMAHHLVGAVFSTAELGSITGWVLHRGLAD